MQIQALQAQQRATDLAKVEQDKREMRREFRYQLETTELRHRLERERQARTALEDRLALQQQIRDLGQRHSGTSASTMPLDFQPLRRMVTDPVQPQASHFVASSLQGLEAEQASGARYQLALEQMEMKKAAIANMEQQQLETAEKIAQQKAEMQQELQAQREVLEAEMKAQQQALQKEKEEATVAATNKGKKEHQEEALQKPALPSAVHTPSPTPSPVPAPVLEKASVATVMPKTNPVRSVRAKVALPEGMANHFFISYDFYAEQMAAPDDLKFLTDQYESMAFRRRGYERDALLQAVIERANFQDLVESEGAERGQEQRLATLPEDLSRFDLDNFRDRDVQADLVALLLLPKGDPSFASCVLVHGMGGTGKTVTAVAVLQEVAVREFFSDVYWVTVGAPLAG
eukprot:g1090.t1